MNLFHKRMDGLLPLTAEAAEWFCTLEDKAVLEVKHHSKDRRSHSQLSLVHVWLRMMAIHFVERGADLGDTPKKQEEKMKLMMKHKFLGTEDVTINQTVIPGQVKHLPTDKGELHRFMNNVEAWAADHGVLLFNPADSEYMKLKEVQNA